MASESYFETWDKVTGRSSDLVKIRTRFGITQAEMASAMGLPFRIYQDIEGGQTEYLPVHQRAAHYAALMLGVAYNKPDAIPPDAMAVPDEQSN